MRFIKAKGLEEEEVCFRQDTLIVPVVSTGNVGQLTVDLFLSSGLSQPSPTVKKVGFLDSELAAPVAGYEVFGPGQPPRLCVNLELFRFAAEGVTLLQQRAPALPGQEEAFARELVAWARGAGFKDILALTGADAAEGLDPTPLGRAGLKCFRAGTAVGSRENGVGYGTSGELEKALSTAGIGALDLERAMGDGWPMAMPLSNGLHDAPDGSGLEFDDEPEGFRGESGDHRFRESEREQRCPPLPTGTGISRHLCREASHGEGKEGTIPLVVLMHFCSEGDNVPHAVTMAGAVNSALKLLPAGGEDVTSPPGGVRWNSPLSWASLYGPPPAADAYL